MDAPRMSLSGIVLDAPDPKELAAFYQRLLGWSVVQEDPTWVKLASPEGGAGLSFQLEPGYRRPSWPVKEDTPPDEQRMMVHLDIQVEDLEAAGRHAVAAGAVLADYQPRPELRVYLDPVGHPFCLFLY